MGMDLTSEEKRLVEYAKEAIVKYLKIRHANGGIDTLYSFLLSRAAKSMRVLVMSQISLMLQFVARDMLLQILSFKRHTNPGLKVSKLIPFQRFKNTVLRHAELAVILSGHKKHQRQQLSSCNTFKEKQAGRFQN